MALSVPHYTIADLDRFPDDGNRYELLDGVLLVTPSPLPPHQVVATRIASRLQAGLDASGEGIVVAPGAVEHLDNTQLQPDVLVYPSAYVSATKWKTVAEHWLAVEVLSRSSHVYDREFKRDAYFALGVREVWLVDLSEQHIEVCTGPGKARIIRDRVRWMSPGRGPVEIVLADVFKNLHTNEDRP